MDNLPEDDRIDFDGFLDGDDEAVYPEDDFMDFIGDDFEEIEEDIVL